MASTVRKQREVDAGALFIFSFVFSSGSQHNRLSIVGEPSILHQPNLEPLSQARPEACLLGDSASCHLGKQNQPPPRCIAVV